MKGDIGGTPQEIRDEVNMSLKGEGLGEGLGIFKGKGRTWKVICDAEMRGRIIRRKWMVWR